MLIPLDMCKRLFNPPFHHISSQDRSGILIPLDSSVEHTFTVCSIFKLFIFRIFVYLRLVRSMSCLSGVCAVCPVCLVWVVLGNGASPPSPTASAGFPHSMYL